MTRSTTLLFHVLEGQAGDPCPVTAGLVDSRLPTGDALSVLTGCLGQVQEPHTWLAETRPVPCEAGFDPACLAAYTEPWPGGEAATSAQNIADGLSHRGLIVDPVEAGADGSCRTDDASCWDLG